MSRKLAILYLLITAILWSTAGLFIKWVSWNPIALAGVRSGIAGLVLFLFWLFKYKAKLPKPNKAVLLGALNYAVLVTLFIAANKLTTSANAILLQFTAPVWLLLIGWFFYKEKASRRDILTVVAVFAGMILFFIGDLEIGNMVGNILAIVSGISMAIMIQHLNKIKDHKPIEITIWGNLLMFLVSIPFLGTISLEPKAIGSILFLGVFQLGLAYVFYTSAIQHVTAIEGILIPVLEPLLNPVWVFIGIGEKPSSIALVGGVIVMAAVVIRNVSYVRGARAERRL
jgi:drug/metabolite transporter (DMT)-like permease